MISSHLFRRIRPPVTRCYDAQIFWVSNLKDVVIHFGDGFAHALAVGFEAVSVRNDAVEGGIRADWLAGDVR